MKVLIRNIAILLLVLCGTFTVYAQSGSNAPQFAEAKINVKTIEAASVVPESVIEDQVFYVIKGGETRTLEGVAFTFKITGEKNEKVYLEYTDPVEINNKEGVTYTQAWTKSGRPLQNKQIHELNGKVNGLSVTCTLKTVKAAATAPLGNQTHEVRVTVFYSNY